MAYADGRIQSSCPTTPNMGTAAKVQAEVPVGDLGQALPHPVPVADADRIGA